MFAFRLTLLALVLVLIGPSWSQPLTKAVETDDGYGYFLDRGALFQLGPSNGLVEIEEKPESESPILSQPEGWSSSFLLKAKKGVFRVTSSQGAPSFKAELEGEGFELTTWGDQVLALEGEGKSLHLIDGKGSRPVTTGDSVGKFQAITVASPELAVFRRGVTFFRLKGAVAEPLDLPFQAAEAEFTVSEGRVLFTHPESNQLFNAGDGTIVNLPGKASYGLRTLISGHALVGCAGYLFLMESNGLNRILPEPKEISRENFQSAPAFLEGRRFHYLNAGRGFPELIVYHPDGRIASQNFPENLKFRTAVVPPVGQPGHPMMFFDSSLEEPKVDDSGRPVTDLESGQPAKVKVSGHQLYIYGVTNHWSVADTQPRTRLIGPVERIGYTVVYATQTLPPNTPGLSRDVNHRYPYPQVILKGLSAITPTDRWAFEVPRGESPSKPRLPEKSWPLLGTDGPLILTSEEGKLLAINPGSGQLEWSSPELGLDEASPHMLSWPNRLGLIASSATTKTLLLIDPQNGQLNADPSITPTLDRSKLGHMLGVAVLCLALAYYIYVAGKRELYIRKIAGLQALDEAVGRATEMGKPVLYVTGLADVDDIQTLAALSILSHVARKTAEYDTPIVATTSRAVTYSAAQEVVRDAFTIAGRPDAFNVESVRYISDDQFGYTAGVDGIMLREKPAANFYMGKFYAESLILAETGHATGAIQIAGTAQPSQLPFFVAACDYTLIGEELFAASAYLSKDPLQVGSLRGQDVGKALVMAFLVLGSLYMTIVQVTGGAQ